MKRCDWIRWEWQTRTCVSRRSTMPPVTRTARRTSTNSSYRKSLTIPTAKSCRNILTLTNPSRKSGFHTKAQRRTQRHEERLLFVSSCERISDVFWRFTTHNFRHFPSNTLKFLREFHGMTLEFALRGCCHVANHLAHRFYCLCHDCPRAGPSARRALVQRSRFGVGPRAWTTGGRIQYRRRTLQFARDTSCLVRQARRHHPQRKVDAGPTTRSSRRNHLQYRGGTYYLWNDFWLVEFTDCLRQHPTALPARWLEVWCGHHAHSAATSEPTRRTRVHFFGRVRQPADRVGRGANVYVRSSHK